MSDPFKELQDMYRVWKFKNKTNTIQTVYLANNDTKRVERGSTVSLQSAMFHQLPDITKFTFIQPSLDDLKMVGLINGDKPKTNTPMPETASDAE